MNINDINIKVHEKWYNKTKIQPDGVTHIIDTSRQYPLYELEIRKSYYDINSKEEVLQRVITDLEEAVEHLKRIKQNEKGKER